jgi:hypothetical protein
MGLLLESRPALTSRIICFSSDPCSCANNLNCPDVEESLQVWGAGDAVITEAAARTVRARVNENMIGIFVLLRSRKNLEDLNNPGDARQRKELKSGSYVDHTDSKMHKNSIRQLFGKKVRDSRKFHYGRLQMIPH